MISNINLKRLKKALSSFTSKAEKVGNTAINIGITPDPLVLPYEIEIGLYRIFKELINNRLNHANTSQIDITIYKENNFLFCQYSDDGIGIKDEYLLNGIGLQNLESRILSFNGTIEYGNNEDKGFHSNMKIPLTHTTAENLEEASDHRTN